MVVGSTRPNVASFERLNPASTLIRFQKLRSNSPAPITRTTASATSAATRPLRSRARVAPAVDRCPDSFNVMLTVCWRRFTSGASPNSIPVTTETTTVKARTTGSREMSAARGNAVRIRGQERAETGKGDSDADGAADQREQDSLGQELSKDPPATRAECGPDGELTLTRFGARQQEVGEIGAGDEQHEPDRTLQHPQRLADAADHVVLQPVEPQPMILLVRDVRLRDSGSSS